MKQIFSIIFIASCLLVVSQANVYAYDFYATTSSGQRLYYKKLTPLSEHKVSVTYPGSNSSLEHNYSGYTRPSGNLTIPSTVTYGSVTYTVTEIGISSFYGCTGLTSVTIPSTIVSIKGSAFRECTGLTNIVLPNSVEHLGGYVFGDCTNLESITLPSSYTEYISTDPVSGCTSLQNIYVAAGNPRYKSVNGVLFTINGDTLARYPQNKSMSYTERQGGLLSQLSNQGGGVLKAVGIGALAGNRHLEVITVDGQIESVGGGAFRNIPHLQSVTFENNVREIGINCCSYNSQLVQIVIGCGVEQIGDDLFYRDSNLMRVVMKPWNPPAVNGLLSSSLLTAVDPTIIVPCGRLSAYANWATRHTHRSEEPVYAYSKRAIGDGSISVLQEPSCTNNSTVTLYATPSSGYHFSYWRIVPANGEPSISYTRALTFSLNSDGIFFYALFEEDEPIGIFADGDTLSYCGNNPYSQSFGISGGGTCDWGIMIPPGNTIGRNYLKSVMYYFNSRYPGIYNLKIYTGGSTTPSTLAHSQYVVFSSDQSGWQEIQLDTIFPIPSQNLWITFSTNGISHPISSCAYSENFNSDWYFYSGSWLHISDYGYNNSWMIKAVTSTTMPTPPAPHVTLTGQNQLAKGQLYTFAAHHPGANWQLEGATPSTGIGETITAAWNTTGWYNIIATATNSSGTGRDTMLVNVVDYTIGDTVSYALNRTKIGCVGANSDGSPLSWGIMLPASFLGNRQYVNGVLVGANLPGNYSLRLYQDGNDAPQTLIYTLPFVVTSADTSQDYYAVTFDTSVSISNTNNLWIIVHTENLTYPAKSCENTTDSNSNWFSLNDTTWNHLPLAGIDESWMIKVVFDSPCGTVSSFPYLQGFENGLDCWTVIDNNNDGFNWELLEYPINNTHSGNFTVSSASYDNNTSSVLYPDNLLISPAFVINNGNLELSYYVNAQDSNYLADHIAVYITTSNNIASIITSTPVEDYTLTSLYSSWVKHTVPLSAYYGQTVYVTIRHYNCSDMFMVNIDDISISVPSVTTYTITALSSNASMGTVSGGGTFSAGSTILLTATPYSGYSFSHWQDGNTDNPRLVTLTQDISFTASFELVRYHLTVVSNDPLRGFVQGDGDFTMADTATALAITLPGNSFLGWDDGNMDNPRRLQLIGDTTLTAIFQELGNELDSIIVHDTTYINVPYAIHDTTVVVDTVTLTEYVHVHDTTIVRDTTYLPVFIHDTAYLAVHDTAIQQDTLLLPVYLHDTSFVYVHVHDTTIVTDTVTLTVTEYINIHDSIVVIDTLTVNHYIYDTGTIVIIDTLRVDNYIYDTVTMTEYVYDTTIVIDTLVVNHYIHDTETVVIIDTLLVDYFIYDTVTMTEYVYDTTIVVDTMIIDHYIHDTGTVVIIDTLLVNNYIYDTVTNTLFDTIIYTVYDTINNYVYDTTIVIDTVTMTEYVYDTTIVVDTMIIDHYIHDTGTVVIIDTLLVNNYIYDTVTNTLFDTVINTIYDTINNFVYDTTIVIDTVTMTEYVYDTTIVVDTMIIDHYIHDTGTVVIIDTLLVDNYIYDTVTLLDTIVMLTDTVTNTIFDTVINTVYDTINNYVYDTTVVIDTVTLTEYVPVHDTTYITLTDTLTLTQYDTVTITVLDTITNTIYDTITNTVYDTVTNTIFDTIDNFIHDTLWLTHTDTLWLIDTVIVHDTIFIHDEGIDEAEAVNAKIYQRNGRIVVESGNGMPLGEVRVFDAVGRRIGEAHPATSWYPSQREGMDGCATFEVPASGVYLVKIGNAPARRIVVIR